MTLCFWITGAEDLPICSYGTLKELDKFDAEFFGYTAVAANAADPMQRIINEVSYEAMADAGIKYICVFACVCVCSVRNGLRHYLLHDLLKIDLQNLIR